MTKKFIVIISYSMAFLLGAIASPVHALETIYEGDVVTLSWIGVLFENILRIMISLVGLGAFLMIVWGSFQWLVSGGDQKKLEQAKLTLTYAVTGIALIFLVWFILVFISKFTGNAALLEFSFGLWQ